MTTQMAFFHLISTFSACQNFLSPNFWPINSNNTTRDTKALYISYDYNTTGFPLDAEGKFRLEHKRFTLNINLSTSRKSGVLLGFREVCEFCGVTNTTHA